MKLPCTDCLILPLCLGKLSNMMQYKYEKKEQLFARYFTNLALQCSLFKKWIYNQIPEKEKSKAIYPIASEFFHLGHIINSYIDSTQNIPSLFLNIIDQ